MSDWTQIRIRKETRALLLGNLAPGPGETYDDIIRDLLWVERHAPARPGRPKGTTKWPFDRMAVGEVAGFDAPYGVEFKDWEAMRTAVWRAEQGTGKRFNISPTREGGQVRVTRVA